MRNRLFDSWFAYANDKEQYVIMVANIQDLEGVDNYAAMILRKDNPHFVDYVSEFNNTVNMFMLKPEHQPGVLHQQVIAWRSHPAQPGEGFDAPPTLERSGSEHRRAVTSSRP